MKSLAGIKSQELDLKATLSEPMGHKEQERDVETLSQESLMPEAAQNPRGEPDF